VNARPVNRGKQTGDRDHDHGRKDDPQDPRPLHPVPPIACTSRIPGLRGPPHLKSTTAERSSRRLPGGRQDSGTCRKEVSSAHEEGQNQGLLEEAGRTVRRRRHGPVASGDPAIPWPGLGGARDRGPGGDRLRGPVLGRGVVPGGDRQGRHPALNGRDSRVATGRSDHEERRDDR